VHPQHIQRTGAILVIGAKAHQGHCNGDICFFSQIPQFLGGIGSNDSASDIENGFLGFIDSLSRNGNLAGMSTDAMSEARQFDRLRLGNRNLSQLHIHGHINQDRSGTSGFGDIERLPKGLRQFGRVFDNHIVFGNRPGDAGGIGLLKGIVSDQFRTHLACDSD
jgi:hypothetical protein